LRVAGAHLEHAETSGHYFRGGCSSAVAAAALFLRNQGPRYNGRSLFQWISRGECLLTVSFNGFPRMRKEKVLFVLKKHLVVYQELTLDPKKIFPPDGGISFFDSLLYRGM
jgi:hypothetical protein